MTAPCGHPVVGGARFRSHDHRLYRPPLRIWYRELHINDLIGYWLQSAVIVMATRASCVLALVLLAATWISGCAAGEQAHQAPELSLDVSAEESYVAGEDVVRIHILATDPQDQNLEFELVEGPERATFTTFRNEAVFDWAPIASDVTDGDPHRLVFSATNDAGLTSERAVNVHIDAGDTATRFVSPTSHLYDPTGDQPLSFDVEVESDEASLVVLTMDRDRSPGGAEFEQVEDFKGTFEWMPSPGQRQQRIHHVVFEADDDTDVIEQEVTIVIPRSSPGTTPPAGNDRNNQCSEDEVISHTPLEAQRHAQPYEIQGSLDDPTRDWQEVLLYWTDDDPLDDDPEYNAEILTLDGDEFSGQIPNPLLGAGDTLETSYSICAFEAGESGDVVCAPEEFVYRFVAYSPDDQKCRDDGIDMGEPQRAGDISFTAWNDYRVCQDTPKYHTAEIAEGESVEIAVSLPAARSPDIDLSVNGEAADIEILPCIGLAYGVVDGPADVELRVAGDDLPYHITAFDQADQCPGAEYEPNDTPDDAILSTDDMAVFDDMAICTDGDRDVYAMELVAGDRLEAYLWFDHQYGDLDMTLFAPSQSDAVVDDGVGIAQGWSSDDDEWISQVTDESGLHYLSIVTSSTPNDYQLIYERICQVTDSFAGNHSRDDARELDFGDHGGLKLCEGQPDYYRLEHSGSDDVTWLGEVIVEYGDADLVDVTLYDDDNNEVGVVDTVDDRIEFEVSPQPAQKIDVAIESSQPAIYELVVLEFDS